MTKAFSMFLWQNSPSVNTPLGESKLNLINTALDAVDTRVVNMDTTKANQTDLLTAVADVTYNESTGVFTVTKKNGSKTTIDTKLEKLAINFTYDSINQQLVIHLDDGTYQYVDLKALITELEFLNSDTVLFSVTDGKVTANIAQGSITADMLEPNYLANVQLYASQALQSAESAEESARNAEESALRAEEAADRASEIAGGDFATNEKVDNIINGTTPVGKAKDADTVDGFHAYEFQAYEPMADTPFPDIKARIDWETNYMRWRVKGSDGTSFPVRVDDADTVDGYHASEILTAKDGELSDLNAFLTRNHFMNATYGSVANLPPSGLTSYAKVVNIGIADSAFTQFYIPINDTGAGKIQCRYYESWANPQWGSWISLATTADLANYLPLTGGVINGPVTFANGSGGVEGGEFYLIKPPTGKFNGNIAIDVANDDFRIFAEHDGVLKGVAFNFDTFRWIETALHTGNSQKVTISDTAPTGGLWVVP